MRRGILCLQRKERTTPILHSDVPITPMLSPDDVYVERKEDGSHVAACDDGRYKSDKRFCGQLTFSCPFLVIKHAFAKMPQMSNIKRTTVIFGSKYIRNRTPRVLRRKVTPHNFRMIYLKFSDVKTLIYVSSKCQSIFQPHLFSNQNLKTFLRCCVAKPTCCEPPGPKSQTKELLLFKIEQK